MKKVADIRTFFKRENTSELGDNSRVNTSNGGDLNVLESEKSIPSQTDEQLHSPASSSQKVFITDLGTKESGPQRPKTGFQKVFVDGQYRSFSPRFYDIYNWLEYSADLQMSFCYVCRNFAIKESLRHMKKFVDSGFNRWKKLPESLKKHDMSEYHIQCLEAYRMYKISSHNVHEKISQHHSTQNQERREYLRKIIDTILVLVRQGLPLRGHREDPNSKNRGNFLEIVEHFAKYDQNFKLYYEQSNNYCSPLIQNEIIGISADLIEKIIVEDVKECGFYSLMVDEARCYKEQQLSIIVRYAKQLKVEERFLGFVDCSSERDANALKNLILNFLESKQLNNIPIIGQSYDGASVMSGFKGGLQAKIKESNPQAIFIHCLAHRLNLVIVDSCSNISSASTFFNAVESLYSHFAKPGNHSDLKRISQALQIKHLSVTSLSKTRWSCRYQNCKSIINNYATIKDALEEEINEGKDKNAVEALGLLTIITKPDFVVNLHIFHFALQSINVLNTFFQTENATIGQAHDTIEATINTFIDNRNNFKDIWSKVIHFANENDISLEPIRSSKRKTMNRENKYLDLPNDTSPLEYWKINVYYPVIDNITNNLQYRFQSVPLAKSVNAFFQLDLEGASEFVENYKDVLDIDCASLKAENIVLKNMFKKEVKEKSVSIESLREKIDKCIYPNMFKLLKVAISLPISSAGCERSFSAMRRIKTWLRSTMHQQRFSNLAILNIENEIVKYNLSAEDVLETFCKKNRKLFND